jgi:hypothetical protein
MKWIYWKDKLPPDGELRIVCSVKAQKTWIGYYNETYTTFFDANGSPVPVSHWMELPSPPEQRQTEKIK